MSDCTMPGERARPLGQGSTRHTYGINIYPSRATPDAMSDCTMPGGRRELDRLARGAPPYVWNTHLSPKSH